MPAPGTIGAALPHDSAERHVRGAARYIDDEPEPRDLLHVALALSPHAHARLLGIDLHAARAALGTAGVALAADAIPGVNDVGPIFGPEPILADVLVEYVGHPYAAVAAPTLDAARRAAKLVRARWEMLAPALSIEDALAQQRFVMPSSTMQRGDAASGLAAAPHRLQGTFAIGGQDHFYLEGQVAMAIPREGGEMLILSSTQHPSEVQKMVARVLGLPIAKVIVEVRRMGGGFGGKETQPAIFAAIAALVATKTGRAAKLRLDRDEDMIITGKRHDFLARYEIGFDDDGRLLALDLTLAARAGYNADLTPPVVDRALFHACNAYFIPDVKIVGHGCRTNTPSNTAFRGFGGPQGMIAGENIIDGVARYLRKDPVMLRRLNFFGPGRNVTHYHQTVDDFILPRITDDLASWARYDETRAAIDAFNRSSPVVKRGLALSPVMFGISFTLTAYNQAGALVHIYADGSIHLNHGGTEMGQGLFTKVAQIVAAEFGLDSAAVRITATSTDKVPNTSATAASSGTDLNGAAAAEACRTIKSRLAAFAARRFGGTPGDVTFSDGEVRGAGWSMSFDEIIHKAYYDRISLSSTGYYATPKIHWDKVKAAGRPFYYFAYGAALCEAEIDTLTGESRIRRADLLHDVGRSINPAIDLGQIEGGFVQGLGWLTSEELVTDGEGRLRSHAPSTYKIPTARDLPPHFRVRMLESAANREDTIHRSKAVGEPPLMLAIAGWLAIKDAIARAVDAPGDIRLDAPATPEAILRALERARTT
jgi:xanthine dehydrogenase large subunit